MLRILLIITLVGYVLYKFGFFRISTHSTVRGNPSNPNFNRKTDGNVNIDSVPDKEKKRSTFKGGEYVDYEEVK